VQTDEGYLEGFDSLLVDEGHLRLKAYPSDKEALNAANDVRAVARLRWFASDFVKARVEHNRLLISDLRMGQEPVYAFTHIVAAIGNPHWREIPTEHIPMSFSDRALTKTWRRLWTE
jgi:inner membrane protein